MDDPAVLEGQVRLVVPPAERLPRHERVDRPTGALGDVGPAPLGRFEDRVLVVLVHGRPVLAIRSERVQDPGVRLEPGARDAAERGERAGPGKQPVAA
ncbi:hypothetical protein WDV91_06780 [Curtobacterium flaccumfaciens pv. flaccumfaciens]